MQIKWNGSAINNDFDMLKLHEGEVGFSINTERYRRDMQDKTSTTEAIVNEKEKTHGSYYFTAELTNSLQEVVELSLRRTNKKLSPIQTNAIQMILLKIARICVGDCNYQDHWDDIAGYAKIGNKEYETD